MIEKKIEQVKNSSILKIKFTNLLNEGKHFKDDLASLRTALHNAQIKNQEEFILFTEVKINQHEERELFNNTFNRVRYFIKSLNGEKFTFTVNGYNSQPFKYEELEVNYPHLRGGGFLLLNAISNYNFKKVIVPTEDTPQA
jgi:hypothetical protein